MLGIVPDGADEPMLNRSINRALDIQHSFLSAQASG
jgi:hypothetical protein